ncbi:MAG: type II secretion system F family protein [Candidatus Omnitrophica bacterium]|nr:type II secretion system F family protein [Candidatus Omnitrophota bacterium]MDD5488743.1 type II secretion system F family protein [Candidatus Omnitrophota bacterium]
MKNFRYKAKKGPEDLIEGVMTAFNPDDVVKKLAEKGYMAVMVEEYMESDDRPRHVALRSMFGVSQKELLSFTRQLVTLVKSGVPMLRSLNILSAQSADRYFSQVIQDIGARIKNGDTLSESLEAFPKIFSRFYSAMVRSGEDSGSLDKALIRISEYYQRQGLIRSRVRSAMIYPLLILTVGILSIVFIFTHVMPRIIPILLNLNTELPLPTRALIFLSSFLKGNWGWMVLIVLMFLLIYSRSIKNKVFRRYISNIKLRIPVLGPLVYRSELARFTRALEVSLQNGIPIINAIEVSLPILNEEAIREKLTEHVKGLEVGEALSSTFAKSGVFPIFAVSLVNIGEESGNLVESLSDIAASFESDCTDAVDIMVNLLEPLMVLFIGLIVGFIVSAVLLPIFQLNVIQL